MYRINRRHKVLIGIETATRSSSHDDYIYIYVNGKVMILFILMKVLRITY